MPLQSAGSFCAIALSMHLQISKANELRRHSSEREHTFVVLARNLSGYKASMWMASSALRFFTASSVWTSLLEELLGRSRPRVAVTLTNKIRLLTCRIPVTLTSLAVMLKALAVSSPINLCKMVVDDAFTPTCKTAKTMKVGHGQGSQLSAIYRHFSPQ